MGQKMLSYGCHTAFFFYLCHFMIQCLQHIRRWLDGHYGASVTVAVVLLALWQAVIALFGVDLCDTGYYLTFYDNIFKAPSSVEYNFMYYLSGVAGGALNAALPETGKWLAMRLAGVMCNVGVMALLAWALRRVLPATAVIGGFLMVVASLVAFPYTFNNDLMSVLLWVAALVLTFTGLTRARWHHLLLAGLLVGINAFTRIPNVLAVALVAMPLLARVHDRDRTWGACWRQSGVMTLGIVAGIVAVIGLMMALGHWDIFRQNMADLVGIATGSSGAASHNAGGMVMGMLRFYGQCLLVGAKMFLLWALVWLLSRYVRQTLLRYCGLLLVACAALYFMWHQSHIMHPLWVMCVTGSIYIIYKQGGDRAIAAWLGLLMLLVFPLGSDGATNNGGIIAWMAAPMAAILWQRRDNLILPLAFIAVGLLQTWSVGAYFDGGHLWYKTAGIYAVSGAEGIHTTPDRARIINETLPQLMQFVDEGDTLLCFGSIPMINHMTGTLPAIGCSWPELLSAQALALRLDALGENLPAIVRQKFNNLGPYWSEPSDDYLQAYPHEDKFMTRDKMDALNRFIATHGYRLVWQNRWFALYHPQGMTLCVQDRPVKKDF